MIKKSKRLFKDLEVSLSISQQNSWMREMFRPSSLPIPARSLIRQMMKKCRSQKKEEQKLKKRSRSLMKTV